MTDASVVDQWAGLAFIQIGDAAESFFGQDHCHVISVLHAELEAILLALKAASVKKFSKIQILSDNAIAIQALKVRELPHAWGSFPVFRQCVEIWQHSIDKLSIDSEVDRYMLSTCLRSFFHIERFSVSFMTFYF
ncbi:hypothetical protein F8388_001862 [Cannabis sativa]|uniref:RNase H type-1 domain-containing protein n=1 Tax=Cannabis sativa TaxID=3483 RepID=A0A7J6FI54_CANSA|nr:hypothetical protein G4B88_029621 [Cannabis sativa]KAF4369440.1 hypothetical protein F8388_001862 [Cannabis sativa]